MAETAHQTPSDAVRAFYAEELAAGTLSEADLSRLQAIAEEKGGELLDWAKTDGGPELKDSLQDLVETAKEHGPAFKAADADGVLTGAEFAKDGVPLVEGMFDVVQTVNEVGSDGAMIILEGSREIIEARGEMDGADPAVIQAQRETIDSAEVEIEGLRDWRNEQLDAAREAIDDRADEIQAIPDMHQLPQPHEGADTPVDDVAAGAVAADTSMTDA
jgi:hypothetical protein